MKIFNKNDLVYALGYGVFSIFYGKLLYMEQANGFYAYAMQITGIDLMQVLMLLLWFLPKIFAMVYLVQYFMEAYDHCFMYFKIRSRNSNLWLKQVLGTTVWKLLLFTIVKVLTVSILVKGIDLVLSMYEFLYILFFVVLYMFVYVCIPNAKALLATACIHILIYEGICILKLLSTQSILFMNNVTMITMMIAVMLNIGIILIFNYALCKQKYER